MQSPERSLALKGLLEVFYSGSYSGATLDALIISLKDKGSKSFLTKLFMGTIEKTLFCDAIINSASSRRLKDIDRTVLNILRLSIYQLYFMDNVSDAAALNSAQILCEERRKIKAKPFVNGVLRNISKDRTGMLNKALKNKSRTKQLSIEYSVPEWIVEYLLESETEDKVKSIFNNINAEHLLSLRVNTKKTDVENAKKLLTDAGLKPQKYEGLPGFRLGKYTPAGNIPGLDEGIFYVQDKSSMEAVSCAGIKPGERVMDLCAAPGGKGLFAANLTGDNGFVSMRDLTQKKVDIIEKNIKTQVADNTEAKVFNATDFDRKWEAAADTVIADLPCSGLGTIGNKPEIKYRLNKVDIEELAALQGKILDVAAGYVKTNGKLLFSTCTLGHLENTDNTRSFLERHPQFTLSLEKTLYPDGEGSVGFYYALMERTQDGH